jgi:DMSO/TMAO reductase YedYZ molybdopterin-dependent catalytic subunit
MTPLENHDISSVPAEGSERHALVAISPRGFYIRHPPKPHILNDFITPDDLLFHTIHMGVAVVDPHKWTLIVTGLVKNPFALSLDQLKRLPQKSITSFHECYGSPIKPPVEAVWRIGNVVWTGVPLAYLLSLASPLPEARFVWSDGLEQGSFHGVTADRYQKDLPLDKAQSAEVLIAYKMNGEPLTKERGGPARLVVPGWFGTNSTKWLCRLTLEDKRAEGPYTTTFYNEIDPEDPEGIKKRPVWEVEVNSIIVQPEPEALLVGPKVAIEGWAWCFEAVTNVHISFDDGENWTAAKVETRKDFSWQKWKIELDLPCGSYSVMARAESASGQIQPLSRRRNHVHVISFSVSALDALVSPSGHLGLPIYAV